MSELVRLRLPVGEDDWFSTEDRSMMQRLGLSAETALEYGLLFWEDQVLHRLDHGAKPSDMYDKLVGEVHEMLDPGDGAPDSTQWQRDFAQNADQFVCMVGRHAKILSDHLGVQHFTRAESRPCNTTLDRLGPTRTVVQVCYEE